MATRERRDVGFSLFFAAFFAVGRTDGMCVVGLFGVWWRRRKELMGISLVIHGAAGRMGQRLVALGVADEALNLIAALDSPEHPRFGADVGDVAGIGGIGIAVTDVLPENAEAVIDFSVPTAASHILKRCIEQRVPIVVATTGMGAEGTALIRQASETIPVVWAPNMSLAVNLAMKLTAVAAAALNSQTTSVDVEILERHHRFKEDAPSGTALKFGELIAARMGQSQETHGRSGRPGVRSGDEIGYHAIRTGDNPGEHTIVFGMLGETIEVTVRATNRDCYASGALAAAKFVARQDPGLYSMFDVLGIAL